MLQEIKHFIDNPEDVPGIPEASAQYLKVRLNPAYLMRTGITDELTKAGWSEGKIMGFLEGVAAAVEIVEQMQEAQRSPPTDEEEEPNVFQ